MIPATLGLYLIHDDDSRHLETTTTLEQFAADNELSDGEVAEIQKEIETHGESFFGGGAAPMFVLTPHE